MKIYYQNIPEKFSSIFLVSCFLVPLYANAAILEEVVVTAQKREQNLQDVGISVSAFTGE